MLKFLNSSVLNIHNGMRKSRMYKMCLHKSRLDLSRMLFQVSKTKQAQYLLSLASIHRTMTQIWFNKQTNKKQIKSLVTEGLNRFSTTRLNSECSCFCKMYRLVQSASSCLCDHMTGSFGWLMLRFLNSSAPITTIEWKKQHVFVWRISYSA